MKKRRRTLRKKKPHSVVDRVPKDIRSAPSTFEAISPDLRRAGWGKDKLTQEIEIAFRNIGVSFLKLKPHFELLQKANEIFLDTFAQIPGNTLVSEIAAMLFGRTFGCFLGAVRLSSSGQLAETWILLRACIENSLYAFYIFGDPKRAAIWVDRHKDKASMDECKRTFKVGKIWIELEKRSKATAKEAKRLYNEAIDWGAHPNERSVFPNVVPKQDGSGLSLRLLTSDPTFVRVGVIFTIRVSSLTFGIFALIFPEVFSDPNLDMKVKNLDAQSRPLSAMLSQKLRGQAGNKQ